MVTAPLEDFYKLCRKYLIRFNKKQLKQLIGLL